MVRKADFETIELELKCMAIFEAFHRWAQIWNGDGWRPRRGNTLQQSSIRWKQVKKNHREIFFNIYQRLQSGFYVWISYFLRKWEEDLRIARVGWCRGSGGLWLNRCGKCEGAQWSGKKSVKEEMNRAERGMIQKVNQTSSQCCRAISTDKRSSGRTRKQCVHVPFVGVNND